MLSFANFKKLYDLASAYDDARLAKIEAQAALRLMHAYERGFAAKLRTRATSPEDARRLLDAIEDMAKSRVAWQMQFLERQRRFESVQRDLARAAKERGLWLRGLRTLPREPSEADSPAEPPLRAEVPNRAPAMVGTAASEKREGAEKTKSAAPVSRPFPAFPIRRVVPLPDRAYFDFLVSAIRNATWRVWASVFIVDIRDTEKGRNPSRVLLQELARARRFGVDVRLLFGDSHSTPGIRLMNMVARSYARHLGMRVRRHRGAEESSTHDKYVLLDSDCLLVGSHNWTNRAFFHSNEDSIAVYSREFNVLKTLEFHRHWCAGSER